MLAQREEALVPLHQTFYVEEMKTLLHAKQFAFGAKRFIAETTLFKGVFNGLKCWAIVVLERFGIIGIQLFVLRNFRNSKELVLQGQF